MRRFTDFLVYGIIVGGILVLTRPGSQGVSLVTALSKGLVNFAQGVTGQPISK